MFTFDAETFVVFPAHAGMSLDSYCLHADEESFPRACGDEPQPHSPIMRGNTFSPRMRG